MKLNITAGAQPQSWECPFCNNHATMREADIFVSRGEISNFPGDHANYEFKTYLCPNSECKMLSAHFSISDDQPPQHPMVGASYGGGGFRPADVRQPINFNMRIIPFGSNKLLPDYVPIAIREDYEEACKILELSPKASATISRRCLQGIIRDFWKINISSDKLFDEIEELGKPEYGVSPKLVKSFHDLRKVGNVGAHMKEAAGKIVNVDVNEAETLLKFIEYVIGLTYVSRDESEKLYHKLDEINETKK